MEKDKYLKIRDLLRIKKITYEEFGDLIGISRPTITNWFQGKSKIDIDLIEIIAEKLGVPVMYFFSDSNAKNLPSQTSLEKEEFLNRLLIEKDARIILLEDKITLLEELHKKTSALQTESATCAGAAGA